jgi:excisionase family DNA binding protein
MLSVRQAAKKLNVEPMTIYRWIKKGLPIKYDWYGSRRVVKIEEMDLWKYLDKIRGENG